MTREEAKDYIREWCPYGRQEEIIKALEQEPCEDCVSRKAVNNLVDDCNSDGLKGIFCSYEDGEKFKGYLKALPLVTPQEPVEPYKDCDTCAYSDEEDGSNCYECIKGMRK